MVYLDYNASTPVDPRVVELVSDVLSSSFANPASSHHASGARAARMIEYSREQVAELAGVSPQSVIFTSGATEAINLALIGLALSATARRVNFVVSAIEHKAVLASADLAAQISGGSVRVVGVDRQGFIDKEQYEIYVDETVAAVAVMLANNEIGVINRATTFAKYAQDRGAVFLSDTTQAAGKIALADEIAHTDIGVLSSHKFYGPKGVGALIADRHQQRNLAPVLSGGGQERGLRGGTPNVPGIAGMGLAAQLVGKELEHDMRQSESQTARIFSRLSASLQSEGLRAPSLNGPELDRLSNTVSIRLPGLDADAILASLQTVELSTGSACQSAVTTPSHVLMALGLTERAASESFRISVGRFTSEADVETAVDELTAAACRVHRLSEKKVVEDGA